MKFAYFALFAHTGDFVKHLKTVQLKRTRKEVGCKLLILKNIIR